MFCVPCAWLEGGGRLGFVFGLSGVATDFEARRKRKIGLYINWKSGHHHQIRKSFKRENFINKRFIW